MRIIEGIRPLGFLAMVGILGLVLGAVTTEGAAHRVEIVAPMKFSPSPLVIAEGDTVEFVNKTGGTHTVTADPTLAKQPSNIKLPAGAEPFHSGPLRPNQSFIRVFSTPGDYRYICLPHEAHGMAGEVIVEPGVEEF